MQVCALLVSGILGLASFAGPAHAQVSNAPDPDISMAFVQNLADEALATLRVETISLDQRESDFRQILHQNFQLEYISLLALGTYRRQASPAQIAEYQIYFSEFILRKYTTLLGGYAGEVFIVTGVRPAGKRDQMVKSEIRPINSPPINTEWRVRLFNEQMKIIDVRIEGISMVQSQKEEFRSILSRGGMEQLIAMLRARVDILPVEQPA